MCVLHVCVYSHEIVHVCVLLYTEDMFSLINSRLISHCLTCNVHNSALEYSIIRRYTNVVCYYDYEHNKIIYDKLVKK